MPDLPKKSHTGSKYLEHLLKKLMLSYIVQSTMYKKVPIIVALPEYYCRVSASFLINHHLLEEKWVGGQGGRGERFI